jgi:Amt family ammonium transporter
MQLGFALLENGMVRSKNSKNILIKNLFDVCVGALAFWLLGFGLAFGQTEAGGFIGTNGGMFAAADFDKLEKNHYLLWIFQFSFAATSATIVSGSLAERTQLPAYLAFSTIMTGFIYPVVVGWCWGGGWLGDVSPEGKGFHDFAGTGIVHMVGGTAGFVGAYILGPRYGKEKNASDRKNVMEEPDTINWISEQNCPQEVEWWVN